MWQVTCECGWRVRGTQEEIVSGLQEHGRSAHDRELTEAEVLAIAVQVEDS